MDAAAEKRKRLEDDDADEAKGKRAKPEETTSASAAVTVEEVEEFYAILRRIHVAVKYFEKRKRKVTFSELEALPEVVDTTTTAGANRACLSLDLNSDPSSDSTVAAPASQLRDASST